ncbi:4-hydroxy-tetrahydrodipicolinate synthase [Aestuariimicrobium ganziense]|uniref:4-hydroxy-tetrahydrodipicolinate synthase n=1 Tax=Aestuariimicrobium ganziense TaxID=2773677 RepID=UPI00194377ED|nr:4-hydroxy-tetrahydrodipicolinate synthase [Aestuariimicrobium ganziense]
MSTETTSPFGTCLVAMVTPMKADGSLHLDDARKLADHLVESGCDGIVVNGTTGESSTLTTDESIEIIAVVASHLAGRAKVVAGIGSNDTAHAVHLAKAALDMGADAGLLVSPYYNKPTQRGLIAHCTAVADATELPIMLYDIPGRTGIPYATPTLLELAKHPQIMAVKDAKCDLWAATKVMAETDLAWYSGADEMNLALLALGAVGVVSVVGHVAAGHYRAMVEAVSSGDLDRARTIHRALVPLTEAIMNTSQGAIMAKAAMAELGVISEPMVRMPLVTSDDADLAKLRSALAATPAVSDLA